MVVDKDLVREELMTLSDGDYVLSIKEQEPSKSPKQMAYYRGVILPIIADFHGYDVDEMHIAIKVHFKKESFSKLTRSEMSKLIDDIIRWSGVEYGISLPNPKE